MGSVASRSLINFAFDNTASAVAMLVLVCEFAMSRCATSLGMTSPPDEEDELPVIDANTDANTMSKILHNEMRDIDAGRLPTYDEVLIAEIAVGVYRYRGNACISADLFRSSSERDQTTALQYCSTV